MICHAGAHAVLDVICGPFRVYVIQASIEREHQQNEQKTNKTQYLRLM
jgi:hypothetical protein